MTYFDFGCYFGEAGERGCGGSSSTKSTILNGLVDTHQAIARNPGGGVSFWSDGNAKLEQIAFALNICDKALKVNQVIFNDKTTIVFWNDHTKTVVKCKEGDTFSKEAGIALCFMKKMLGNKGNYNKVLREALEKGDRK